MTAPINGPKNGFQTSVAGMAREANRTARAAEEINRAFTSAQNAQAADSMSVRNDTAQVVPAVEDAVRGAVLPPAGDVAAAIVSLLQASTAYRANAAAARVTGDVESELVKAFKR